MSLVDHLGTDPVGRGAGWEKTSAAVKLSIALGQFKDATEMSGGELFGAMVENVIAAIQGGCAPSQWREVGHRVAAEIERRMVVR